MSDIKRPYSPGPSQEYRIASLLEIRSAINAARKPISPHEHKPLQELLSDALEFVDTELAAEFSDNRTDSIGRAFARQEGESEVAFFQRIFPTSPVPGEIESLDAAVKS